MKIKFFCISPCKEGNREGIFINENKVKDNRLTKNDIPKKILEEKYFDNIIVLNKIWLLIIKRTLATYTCGY